MTEAFHETGESPATRTIGSDLNFSRSSTPRDLITGLVDSASRGDRAAFGELYRQRVDKVAAYVHSITRNQADLEDVVANVFVRAWKRLPTLKNVNKFDSWLFSIAHNQALDSARRRRESNVPFDEALESATKNPDDMPDLATIRRSETEDLMSAVAKLSPEPRMVLILRFLHGMSHEEVALQLDKKPEAVRAMQYRALGRLRTILQSEQVPTESN